LAGPVGAGVSAASSAASAKQLQNVLAKLSQFLDAMGLPHNRDAVRSALTGGGNGGTGGGGDLVRRLLDYFSAGEFRRTTLPCVPCTAACREKIEVTDDHVVRKLVGFVRALDGYVRLAKNTTLVRLMHDYVVARVASRKLPVLKHTGLEPFLWAGQVLVRYDQVMSPVRYRVLQWVFANYVDYYIPDALKPYVKYNLKQLNRELMTAFKPQVIAFLTGKDEDIAPVVGLLLRHLIRINRLHFQVTSDKLGCIVCKTMPFSCRSAYKTEDLKLRAALTTAGSAARAVRAGSLRAVRAGGLRAVRAVGVRL
jgi:hypothetical protein